MATGLFSVQPISPGCPFPYHSSNSTALSCDVVFASAFSNSLAWRSAGIAFSSTMLVFSVLEWAGFVQRYVDRARRMGWRTSWVREWYRLRSFKLQTLQALVALFTINLLFAVDPYGIFGTFPPEFSRVCLCGALVTCVSVALLFDLSMSGVLQQALLQRQRMLPIVVIVALLADVSFTVCDGSPGRVGVACHTAANVYVSVVLGLGGCTAFAHTIPAWRRLMCSTIVVHPSPSSETVEASGRSASLRADTSASQTVMLPPLRHVRPTRSEAAVVPWNDTGCHSPPVSVTDAAVSPLSSRDNALASRSASVAMTTELMTPPQPTTQMTYATELMMSPPPLTTHVIHVTECNQGDGPDPHSGGVVKLRAESEPGRGGGIDNVQLRYVVSDGGALSRSAAAGSANTQGHPRVPESPSVPTAAVQTDEGGRASRTASSPSSLAVSVEGPALTGEHGSLSCVELRLLVTSTVYYILQLVVAVAALQLAAGTSPTDAVSSSGVVPFDGPDPIRAVYSRPSVLYAFWLVPVVSLVVASDGHALRAIASCWKRSCRRGRRQRAVRQSATSPLPAQAVVAPEV